MIRYFSIGKAFYGGDSYVVSSPYLIRLLFYHVITDTGQDEKKCENLINDPTLTVNNFLMDCDLLMQFFFIENAFNENHLCVVSSLYIIRLVSYHVMTKYSKSEKNLVEI